MANIDIEGLLAQDLSAGTEAFREELLERCLAELDRAQTDGVELADDELEMLAAAGVPYANMDEGLPR